MSGSYWSLVTILGPIVLILVIGYALMRKRRLTRHERVEQHEAIEDVYRGGEGGIGAPPDRRSPVPPKEPVADRIDA